MELQQTEKHLVQRLLWTTEPEASQIALDLVCIIANDMRARMTKLVEREVKYARKGEVIVITKKKNPSYWGKRLAKRRADLNLYTNNLLHFEAKEAVIRKKGEDYIQDFLSRKGLNGLEFDDYYTVEADQFMELVNITPSIPMMM